MEMVRTRFLKKQDTLLGSFIRNTSCSRGWLRVVVHIFFGTLIVSSFVLIVLMALSNSHRASQSINSRCGINTCTVICEETPYYGNYEDNIIQALSEVPINCQSISLKLNQPTFANSRIPENWLSGVFLNIRNLNIIGGNIKYISPKAFMSPLNSNLRSLVLTKIEINVWDDEMLLGLSNLEQLHIIDCKLNKINTNAITAIGNTLGFLRILSIGSWDPKNITSSENLIELKVVDFSFNSFEYVLRNGTFSKLQQCQVLYLNSCKIKAIGPGTFDQLENIKTIYLNDNLLVTIPVGLFNKILPFKPKIALQDNLWFCKCSENDLRTLFRKGILIEDPICRFPDAFKGLMFSDLEDYCENSIIIENSIEQNPINSNESKDSRYRCQNDSGIVFTNGACYEENLSNNSINLISYEHNTCYLNRISINDIKTITINAGWGSNSYSNWIKPIFAIQSYPYSMVEIEASADQGFGLLWFQSSCKYEVYCVNNIPRSLKVYNLNEKEYYTFCPFNLSFGTVMTNKCVSYNLVNFEHLYQNTSGNTQGLLLYILISLGCLIFGALSVYALIQRNPSLLKGNKRVILVKHKSIEALILPPQLSKRNKLVSESTTMTKHVFEKQKIFLLTDNLKKLSPQDLMRSTSMRSSESNEAGYISPLQPTEEQLTEWRSNQIIKQFNDTLTSEPETVSFCSIHDQESMPYYYVPIHANEKIYETPKQY
ncbi:unnamed protein product, partial [Brenthis ino]